MRIFSQITPRIVYSTCLSHSLNVAGSEFKKALLVATKVIKYASKLFKNSAKGRRLFREHAGVEAQVLSEVRWFTAAEMAAQLHKNMPSLIHVVNHPDNFFPEVRAKLSLLLTSKESVVLLELAAYVDASSDMIQACYRLESDTFTAPSAFMWWNRVLENGEIITGRQQFNPKPPVAPLLQDMCERLAPDDLAQQQLYFQQTIIKVYGPFDKMQEDTDGRLASTIGVMEAFQLVRYNYVASVPLRAVSKSLIWLARLPYIYDMLPRLQAELPAFYKSCVEACITHPNPSLEVQWEFMNSIALEHPTWFAAAKEIGLIMTSSACVERLFSMYDALFSKLQTRTLQDGRETAVMLRYNGLHRSYY
jgi:hypothetical protein